MWKHRYTIAGIFGTIALLVLFAYSGGSSESPAGASASSSGGALTANETFYDFGIVAMANGKVSRDFTVANTGTGTVTIRRLFTSCMCTTATYVKGDRIQGPFGMPGHGVVPSINEEIAPGESAVVTAIFDPNAHGPAGIGTIERTITLETDSGKPFNLNFRAQVVP